MHVCDESCVCPVDGKPLLYSPAGRQHACQDPECEHAHGIVGDEARHYDTARRSLAATLRGMAETLAGQLEAPSPFAAGIWAYDMVLPKWPEPKGRRCYTASFGPVHYRGCRCKR